MKTLFFTLLCFVLLVSPSTAQTLSLSKGDIFPKIMFKTVDGELLKTEDLIGKVVFYNFYFAACPPCIAQKDGLNALYEKFHADGVVFISVTFDSIETIKQFRNVHGMRFKIVSVNREEISRYTTIFPINILVGVDGKIVLNDGDFNAALENKEIITTFTPAILRELHKLNN